MRTMPGSNPIFSPNEPLSAPASLFRAPSGSVIVERFAWPHVLFNRAFATCYGLGLPECHARVAMRSSRLGTLNSLALSETKHARMPAPLGTEWKNT